MSAVATPPPETAAPPQARPRKFWQRKAVSTAQPKPRLPQKHRLAILLIACSSFTILPLMLYVAQARLNPPAGPEKPKLALADALTALEKSRYQEAERILLELKKYDLLTDDDRGGVEYLQGMLTAQDAERMWERDRTRFARKSVRSLATAHLHGIPTGHERPALSTLCRMMIAGGFDEEARPYLDRALSDPTLEKTELHRLAAIAWSSDPKPDYARALRENTAYLADETLLTTPRQDGLLQQARIQFRMNQIDECRKTLAEIRPDATAALEGLLLAAEVEIDAARKTTTDEERRKADYRKATEILGRALISGNGRETVQRRALYLTAVCQRESGDPRAARETFQKVRTTYQQTSEGIAAAVAEAMLDRELGLDDDVVPVLIAAVEAAGNAEDYVNPLLPFEELRETVIAAYRRQTNRRSYQSAGELARAAAGILSKETSLELSALAHIARAESLLEDLDILSHARIENILTEAAGFYRLAADDYSELAKFAFASPAYSEIIWKAGEYYLLAKDYTTALRRLREYLNYELRNRRPLALLRLGECYLMLDRPDDALGVLQECIEQYPSDSASYRARLLAARALLDKGDRERAKTLYLVNLESGQLTPASTEWRDALFALGTLLYGEGETQTATGKVRDAAPSVVLEAEHKAREYYEESIRRLGEAVERYPNSPQVVPSRYLISEAYRALAAYPRDRLNSTTIRTARDEYAKELRKLLIASMGQSLAVQEALSNRREDHPLTPLEHVLLRNCYFDQAATLYELERYDEAIGVYLTMINRYQSDPEVLDAYFQLVACHRKRGNTAEAAAVLEQARIALKRLGKEQLDFSATTNHTPIEWQRLIDWMGNL